MRPPEAKNIMVFCEYAGTHCGLTPNLASQTVRYMCPRINAVSILIATVVQRGEMVCACFYYAQSFITGQIFSKCRQ